MRRVEVSSSPGPSPFSHSHSPEGVEGKFSEVRMQLVVYDAGMKRYVTTATRNKRKPRAE
jgi:hypothetical protein